MNQLISMQLFKKCLYIIIAAITIASCNEHPQELGPNPQVIYSIQGRLRTTEIPAGEMPFSVKVSKLDPRLINKLITMKYIDADSYEVIYKVDHKQQRHQCQFGQPLTAPEMEIIVSKTKDYDEAAVNSLRHIEYVFKVKNG